jgi:hypothetical protein
VIQELLGQFTALWWQSDTRMPPPGPAYTPRQQAARETHLRQFVDTLTSTPKRPLRTPAERQATQEHLLAALERFVCAALDLEKHHLDVILSPDFTRLATAFAQTARRFDPAVRDADVFQASRNAWVMAGLQMLFGRPVHLTPSVFAYSMLYPYSDNYLDDPAIPVETKAVFQEHLARRLAGENVAPANAHERAIYALVGMIEGQYERSRYPRVYESLLGIHRAQGRSMSLLCGDVSPYEVDVLGISIEKGGASVLADGYLVAGELSPAQRTFTFGWGALLQIMDDLQDVAQDRREGRLTVFSQTARRWPLDALTNRTLHFGQRVLGRLDDLDAPGTVPLKELMHRSATLLTISAAGQAGRLYTKAYRRELETHTPFRFSVLKKHVKKLDRQRSALTRVINAFVTSDDLADVPTPTLTLCKNPERT